MDRAHGDQVGLVLLVVVVEVVDVLEVICIESARGGVLVGLDVVGVLLHLELDALILELGGGEVREDLGVRGGRGAHGQRGGRGGGTGRASGSGAGTAVAATSESHGTKASHGCEEATTREVDVEVRHSNLPFLLDKLVY